MKIPNNLYWIGSFIILALTLAYFALNYPAISIDNGRPWYHAHKIEASFVLGAFPLSTLLAVRAFLGDLEKQSIREKAC